MLRARLLRSSPFRLAVIFSVLFISAFIASSFVAVKLVRAHLIEKLDGDLHDTYFVLAASYGDSDVEDLIGFVESHVAINQSPDQVFLLTDAAQSRLAGNIKPISLPEGWSTLDSSRLGLGGGERYRVFAGSVGPNQLLVGKSYADTDEVGEIVTRTFIWASLIVLVGAIAGGAFLAHKIQRRMDAIARTMGRVSEGELTARIPLIGNGDDVDILSGQINTTLDRLSSLFEGMRQVSADIAHDLKTPLNRLKMTIQTAMDKKDAGLSVDLELAEADAESDRINETFDALLRISQIEAGARKARFTRVVLSDVMSTIAEAYIEVANENRQTLTLDTDREKLTILGDQQLLLQMCANLVENAITHCPVGTRINLGLKAEENGVALSVSDDGPGIPEAERSNVFLRLYRLEKSRTTPGSGLGLSLVKAIAELHGARVALMENSPGLRVNIHFSVAEKRDEHATT